MSVDEATVRRVAHLARIRVEESELAHLAGEVSGILQWVEQLNQVDTAGVEPMASVHEGRLRWREDVVDDGGRPEDVLANAPGGTAGFFAVPKVVE